MGGRVVLEHTPFGFAHAPLVHVHFALMHTAFRELSQTGDQKQVPPVSVEHVWPSARVKPRPMITQSCKFICILWSHRMPRGGGFSAANRLALVCCQGTAQLCFDYEQAKQRSGNRNCAKIYTIDLENICFSLWRCAENVGDRRQWIGSATAGFTPDDRRLCVRCQPVSTPSPAATRLAQRHDSAAMKPRH